jgi:hypothetical protein
MKKLTSHKLLFAIVGTTFLIVIAGFFAFRPTITQAMQSWIATEDSNTSFSYQGYLEESGNPANGEYDFEFKLYEIPDLGLGDVLGTDAKDNVPVDDGLFTVQIDFGEVFSTGMPFWLEIGVRPGTSTGDYTTLSPRQSIGHTPYALHAASIADGSVTENKIGAGCDTSQVLAFTGNHWECVHADLDITPTQVVSHSLTIDTVPVNAEVDLSMLGIDIEVEEYLDGLGNIRKLPGSMSVKPFDIVCKEPCVGVESWFETILGGGPDRRVVSIVVADGAGTVTWDLSNCFPYEMWGQLSPNGKELYWRYGIQCDELEVETLTAAYYGAVLPHYPPSTSELEKDSVLPPLQQIYNYMTFNFSPYDGLVNLRTLHIWVEVTLFNDGVHPLLRHIPGQEHWSDFDVLCSGHCADLEEWSQDVIAGSLSRESGTLFIQNEVGAYAQEWELYDCFPASTGTAISADGVMSYERFTMACDQFIPDVFTP